MRQYKRIHRKNLFSTPVPAHIKTPKRQLNLIKILWLAVKKTCTLIGGVVLFSAVLTMCTISPALQEKVVTLPSDMVLVMKLDGKLGDLPVEESFVDAFEDNPRTLKSYIDAIYAAKDDPRVKGVYAQYLGGRYSVTQVQELRQAIKDFRDSGKFTYVYAPSYNGGLGAYYLVSAFDEIWLQPLGNLSVSGLNAEIPFFRNVLDKIGVEPNFYQRKEFKSAYESFTNTKISDANKLAMTDLIEDMSDVLSRDLSADLDISQDQFKGLVDHGLFLAGEAQKAGLVDVVGFEDDLRDIIEGKVASGKDGYLYFDTYHNHVLNQKNVIGGPRVALIYAVGAIIGSRENARAPSGFVDDGYAEASEISKALLDAAEDLSVRAVVLRVDSPGGSPVASETILHAVQKVRDAGKPVVVSMGSAAASGGYWISAYADYIFASPLTLTGSIGVLGGKISTQEMWGKIGVNWDRIHWGKNSAMWSMNTPFSASEAERMNAMLDNIYASFIERVAKGRDMSTQDAEKIARGRVWSGKSALDAGLVDQLGGLNDALDYVAVQLGENDRRDIQVAIMPKPLNAVEKLVELLEGQVHAGEIIGMQADLISYLRPVLQQVNVVREVSRSGVSVYEPITVH